MSKHNSDLCTHCSLPTGVLGLERNLDGEKHTFCCYGCCLAFQVGIGKSDEPQAAWLLIRLGVGGFLAMNIMLFSLLLYSEVFNPLDTELVQGVHLVLWVLATPVLLILGGPFIQNAWHNAVRGRASSDTLIALGACSAYGYSVASILMGGKDVYFDTVTMVLVLFTLGRYLEAAGRAHCSRSLEPMLNNTEGSAMVLLDGEFASLAIADLLPGMTLRVSAGERIAIDGIIIEGCSKVDESMLTGESQPVKKSPGINVLAGTLNGEGQLLVEATVTGADTRWACICRSVREALGRKSPLQRIADKVAAYFVPVVLFLAFITIGYHAQHGDFSDALLAGVAVLVVACPCALGLATPLATSLGISNAAQRGCLIRGGEVFETLADIHAVAFDKTGTLTSGLAHVYQVISVGDVSQNELLMRAGALEQGCRHPIAQGVLAAIKQRKLLPQTASSIRQRPGLGIEGEIDGEVSVIGNARLMQEMGWDISAELIASIADVEHVGHAQVYLGWAGHVRGVLLLDDELTTQAESIIEQIHGLGMATCLLSGDRFVATQRVGLALDVGSFQAELSPEDKVHALKEWMQQYKGVAMVGDGLNDGPVLSAATVGVAVGSATDLVREVADVVLPSDGLIYLPWIFTLSRKVKQVIISNLFWAFSYNVVALSMAVAGLLQPILAAGLMAGSSVIVILNSLRLNNFQGSLESGAGQSNAKGYAYDVKKTAP